MHSVTAEIRGEHRNSNMRSVLHKIIVNPRFVRVLASYGCTENEIAGLFQCDQSVISKRFGIQYHKGREHMKCRLRKKQIQLAMKGNLGMLVWLGKQYLGQSEKQEIGGKNGEPIVFKVVYG